MRILAFAYACEPDAGSEPGAGWAWSRMLASLGETWVITRTNNAPRIEAALRDASDAEHLHFVYVDLPPWARFWKRGHRGIRLYYVLWQMYALTRARRLRREQRFDLVWHLTLANAWIGSLAPFTRLPFVYGPVGGGLHPPIRLATTMGLRGAAYELARASARGVGRYANPVARLAWRRAHLILVQTAETGDWLPRRYRSKVAVFPNVVIDHAGVPGDRHDGTPPAARPQRALFAGRLLPLKGVSLAIRAVALLPGWRLQIAGVGSDEVRLRRLTRRLGVERRVEFLGWRSRADLFQIMRADADVFLFPSLHDEAGWVVAEALGCGLPVVCLNLGGPPLLAGSAGLAAAASGGSGHVAAALAGLLAASDPPTSDEATARAQGWTLEARTAELHDLLRRRRLVSAPPMPTPVGGMVRQ